MTTKTDGGPAFSRAGFSGPTVFGKPVDGMSLRQYAAIHLCVPDSGTDWLDDMIRQRMRDDLAARAMEGLIASNDEGAGDRIEDIPVYAHLIADAMLARRENKL